MIKYKLHATIGLPDYSNIQPEVELEGENLQELHDIAMAHISDVWAKYGKAPLKSNGGSDKPLEKLETFTGETLMVDAANHLYYDTEGRLLMSGSAYADSVSPKFDKAMLLPKTAKAWGVDEAALADIWELAGKVSTEYGSAIHTALEAWVKYNEVGAKIAEKKGLDYNYVLPKNDHIRKIVESLYKVDGGGELMSEVLISDIKNGRAGRVDLLKILDKEKKVCRIQDYKTNNDIDEKKMLKYNHQLSFYANIMMAHGWTVEGLDLLHYDGNDWTVYPLEVLDLVQ